MARPLLALALALLACRPAAPRVATPPAEARPTSVLAGYEGPPPGDPVADEGARLSEGPLAEAAAREAPGMAPEGDLLASKLAAGEILEQEIRLQPGRCYTLIAVGGQGVDEVDAEISRLTPVRGKGEVLAADAGPGPVAVLGGGGACFHYREKTPLPARFVVRARAGAGVVVSQLYAR